MIDDCFNGYTGSGMHAAVNCPPAPQAGLRLVTGAFRTHAKLPSDRDIVVEEIERGSGRGANDNGRDGRVKSMLHIYHPPKAMKEE